MTLTLKSIILLFVAISLCQSLQIQQLEMHFNTSYNEYTLSASISSNLHQPFEVYAPIFEELEGSVVQFAPKKNQKFLITPEFIEKEELLYNNYEEGQYWYGFKKGFISEDPPQYEGQFAYSRITIGNEKRDTLLPLFSLPLGILDFGSLYLCGHVLVSYEQTDQVIDITVFSQNQSFHLFPTALWGFRKREQQISYTRQTFPLGSKIELDISDNEYCVLSAELPNNIYSISEQVTFTLDELLKYSSNLQVRKHQQKEATMTEEQL